MKLLVALLMVLLLLLSHVAIPAKAYEVDFFQLFEEHGSMMMLVEVESGTIVNANRAAIQFYGYPREQLMGMPIDDINMLEPAAIEEERRAAAEQKRNYFVFPHLLANGQVRTVEVYSYPFEAGGESLLYSIIQDVTDREASETQLIESHERLREAEIIADLGHWRIDFEENKVLLSDGAMAVYGVEQREWRIEDIQKIPLPEYRDMLDRVLYELVHENKPYDVEFRIRRPSDNQIASVRFVAGYNVENNIMLGVMVDITQHKLAEAQIKRQSAVIIFTIVIFLIILIAFTIILLKSIHSLKLTQKNQQEQFLLERLITDVSTSFVKSTAKNLDGKLQAMIEKVGVTLGVDRSYIFQFSPDKQKMSNVYEWCAEGIASHKQQYQDTSVSTFPWLTEMILKKEYVFIPDVSQLPEEALPDKTILHTQRIQSFLCIPVTVEGNIEGFLGFDMEKCKRVWTQEQIEFLSNLTNMLTDALEKDSIEKRLINEKERLKITLLSVGDGVIATDYHGIINTFNAIAQQLTGWTEEEAIGQPFENVFNVINEHSRERCPNPILKVLNTGKISGLANHTILIARDGTERAITDSAAPIKDENGGIEGVVLVFRDATDEKQRQANIEYISYHDYLTGLYNRRFFEEEARRLDTERNLPISIVMADVNGLKLTNDAFGHAKGDELLKAAAETIKGECRSDDIIARLGGDEFVILLPGTSAEETAQIVQRIQGRCATVKLDSISLSISFGWSAKHTADVDIQSVLKQAEDDMYKQKLFESPSMRGKTIDAILNTLHEKNIREENHSNRVSNICEAIGIEMGVSDREINVLKTVGLLHDIGKIAIDDIILNKPGALNEEEWSEIRRHPEVGYRILSAVNDMSELADYVLAHQERWDGKGYPKGLKGEEIPLFSRILAVADAFDAMISDRAYRDALPQAIAIEELRKNAGTQFDPAIVDIFIHKVYKVYEGTGFFIS